MIKELMLVPRVLYSMFFVWLSPAITGSGEIILFAVLTSLSVLFSFIWQYCVLYFVLLEMEVQQRSVALLGWLVISAVIGAWSLYEMMNFNFMQDSSIEIMAENFSLKMVAYLVAMGMFVGGVCTRRAFEMHKGL